MYMWNTKNFIFKETYVRIKNLKVEEMKMKKMLTLYESIFFSLK